MVKEDLGVWLSALFVYWTYNTFHSFLWYISSSQMLQMTQWSTLVSISPTFKQLAWQVDVTSDTIPATLSLKFLGSIASICWPLPLDPWETYRSGPCTNDHVVRSLYAHGWSSHTFFVSYLNGTAVPTRHSLSLLLTLFVLKTEATLFWISWYWSSFAHVLQCITETYFLQLFY